MDALISHSHGLEGQQRFGAEFSPLESVRAAEGNESCFVDSLSDCNTDSPSKLVINTSKMVKDEFETFFPVTADNRDPGTVIDPLSAGLVSAEMNTKP